jgi:protease-4
LERLGIERRLFTAGEHKGFLDPFSPAKPEDVSHLRAVLSQVHKQFIEVVRRGRGDRIKDQDGLFSGLIWSGEQSVRLGLVDALGSSALVAREVIGAEKLVDFTRHEHVLDRLANRIGSVLAAALAAQGTHSAISLR